MLVSVSERARWAEAHFPPPVGPICPGVFLLYYAVQHLQMALELSGLRFKEIEHCEFRNQVIPPAQLLLTYEADLKSLKFKLTLADIHGQLVMDATVGLQIYQLHNLRFDRPWYQVAQTRERVARLLPQGDNFQFVDFLTHDSEEYVRGFFRLPEVWGLQYRAEKQFIPDPLLLEAACQTALLSFRKREPEGLIVLRRIQGQFRDLAPDYHQAGEILLVAREPRVKCGIGSAEVTVSFPDGYGPLFKGRVTGAAQAYQERRTAQATTTE